jgi:hypothetical protein
VVKQRRHVEREGKPENIENPGNNIFNLIKYLVI